MAVNCVAHNNSFIGFDVGYASTILDCTARENGSGIAVNGMSTIMRCASYENSAVGIWVRDKCLVKDNTAVNNGAEGIYVRDYGTGCRVEANLVTGNDTGIRILDDPQVIGHIILKNTAGGNTANYDMGTGNAYGPIINVSGAGDISGVTGANHPWANFEF